MWNAGRKYLIAWQPMWNREWETIQDSGMRNSGYEMPDTDGFAGFGFAG